jgi:hypothetical protein
MAEETDDVFGHFENMGLSRSHDKNDGETSGVILEKFQPQMIKGYLNLTG